MREPRAEPFAAAFRGTGLQPFRGLTTLVEWQFAKLASTSFQPVRPPPNPAANRLAITKPVGLCAHGIHPMASKAPSKNAKKPKTPPAKNKPATRPTKSKTTKVGPESTRPQSIRSVRETPKSIPAKPTYVPRAMPAHDDDDVLMAHGAGGGAGFGRCGGRLLGSRLEQTLCDRLGQAGVAHSHSPRHYEVRMAEGQVAAYAPMIVLRGRGREGKSVVIEAAEESESSILKKIVSFRGQYGQEFYVILVAHDDVLDDVELAAYDEACSSTNANTLISRLAE
jgi:hypothetical protein